jgi:glycosyltransferase involved in cell wall biosynthesis
MKIMFFCVAEQFRVEIVHLFPLLAQMTHEFTICPIIREADMAKYQQTLSQIESLNHNISIDPIFINSKTMNPRNLLNPYILFSDARTILKAVRRNKSDAIICYYIIHAYPLLLLKRIFGFSLNVVAQGSDVLLDNSPFEKVIKKFVIEGSDLIFACSWELKEKIEKEFGRSVSITPSSADPSFFKPLNLKIPLRRKWGIQTKKQVIISVGALSKLKGMDLIIRSLQKLDFQDVDLLIVGEGPERKSLEMLAESLGLKERVRFLGFMNRKDLLELYNLSDIFALTSYSEGLSRVLIEAMDCGCIPIVTNVGSNATVVSDGFNGYVIKTGDSVKFTEKVNEILLLSMEQKSLMQTRARRTAEDGFDSRKTLKNLICRVVSEQ